MAELQMDGATLNKITGQLDKSKPVSLSYAGYGRTVALAETLTAHLEAQGFTIGGIMQGGAGYSPRPSQALEVWPDGIKLGGITMMPGQQIVRFDGDIPV